MNIKHMTNDRVVNISVEAPLDGVYRYELIPAEKPMDYYIDIWYQFGMSKTKEQLLSEHDDAVYLKAGDRVEINTEGTVFIKKKTNPLRLVVNNGE